MHYKAEYVWLLLLDKINLTACLQKAENEHGLDEILFEKLTC